MANKTIGDLTGATVPLRGSDKIELERAGSSVRGTVGGVMRPFGRQLFRDLALPNSYVTTVESNSWRKVIWVKELGLFVAVAGSGTNRVMTSPDGVNWTARSASQANTWASVAWSPSLSLLVAVAEDGTNRVMTSPDGTTWTNRTAASAQIWTDVVWAAALGLFVAVSNDGTNQFMTSPDGTTWTARAAAESNSKNAITWSAELGLLVSVSSSGTNRVETSPDGVNWTARTAALAQNWVGLAWSPEAGVFVAVANSGTSQRVMTSPDGTTWTARDTANLALIRVVWIESLALFVAITNATTDYPFALSNDGITWTQVYVPGTESGWRTVAYSNEASVFVALSTSGTKRMLRNVSAGLDTAIITDPFNKLLFNMAVAPDSARQAFYRQLIQGLIADGIWSKLDALYILAAHDIQASRINWRYPATYLAQIIGTPGFQVDTGWVGATSSYLDSGMNMGTGGWNYSQNSASLFAWSLTNTAANDEIVGGKSNLAIISPRTAGGNTAGRINDGSDTAISQSSSIGLFAMNRSGASAREIYKNGTSIGSDTTASSSIAAIGNMLICAGGATPTISTKRICVAGWGASLTATEHGNLYTRLSAYINTALGL